MVRGGETLASIAADLWGDASLWYKLAEANGLTAQSALSEGQRLSIPAGVMKSTHNASTFKPYDPSETIGDTSPTTRKPPKKAKNCGMFGMILLVVVAVAVSAITYGALTGPSTGLLASIGAGAVSGAAGSIASQGVGVATGIQDKFSWKGVAMAAISGAVGGGVGQVLGKGAMAGSQFLGDAVRGAASSAISQGIGVATGLQKKFDWAGVAAAGMAAGVAGAIGRHAFGVNAGNFAKSASGYAQRAVVGGAAAIASAASRTLIEGSSFGDNIIAAIPDVIGQTVGAIAADGISGRWVRSAPVGPGAGETSGTAQSGAGVGNGAAATPVAGVGGGQVGTADDTAIIINGSRFSSLPTDYDFARSRRLGGSENLHPALITSWSGSAALLQSASASRYSARPKVGWGPPLISPDDAMPSFPTPPPLQKGEGSGPFASELPTVSDYAFLKALEDATTVIQLAGYDDASRHMRHYLGSSGRTLSLDVQEMLAEQSDFEAFASKRHRIDIVARATNHIRSEYHGEPMTFAITSPWSNMDAKGFNWYYALGGFSLSHTALVTATPARGGFVNVKIDSQLHVFDRYNWDVGKSVSPLGITITDERMGALHRSGLAREYDMRGTLDLPRMRFNMNPKVFQYAPSPPPVPTQGTRR